MPELPEVETVVRQLRSKILGKTIINLRIFDEMVVDQRILNILPSSILAVERRGKSIIVTLDSGNNLLIQLRMTGHFYYIEDTNSSDNSYQKHLSGIFDLSDNSRLTFNEIRRFGSVRLFNKQQLQKELADLGPEPLEINSKEFVKRIKSYPGANLKMKLLDQSCLAGIGNIYAQEALYHSGINPLRRINAVSEKELLVLYEEMQRILRAAIKNNGTTVENFSHLTGKGNFQNFLAVYGRDFCPKNHKVLKTKIGGRGTSYCPECQK